MAHPERHHPLADPAGAEGPGPSVSQGTGGRLRQAGVRAEQRRGVEGEAGSGPRRRHGCRLDDAGDEARGQGGLKAYQDNGYLQPHFTDEEERAGVPFSLSEAIFSGVVLEAKTITNADTGLDFEHARIKTLGGEVDLVVHPEAPTGFPLREGAIVQGTFCLSGLLLR